MSVKFSNYLSKLQKDIEEASNVATQCCDTINRFRRKTGFTESLGRMISKTDYDAYTEEELHAEICYGECLLIKGCPIMFLLRNIRDIYRAPQKDLF